VVDTWAQPTVPRPRIISSGICFRLQQLRVPIRLVLSDGGLRYYSPSQCYFPAIDTGQLQGSPDRQVVGRHHETSRTA
jgi:hypothetical protein